MRLLVTLVLVVLSNRSSGHWVVPIVSNGQFIAPYGYVVHHQPLPDFIKPEGSPVSRETLEENSGEGFLQQIPDISVEQAHLNPDDTQKPGSDQVPNILFNGPQTDGSYDFSYQLGDQSRSEKSDANGNVQGSYSYTGPDGNQVQITYSAGANKGYIPEGPGLVPPPVHPVQEPWDDSQNPEPVDDSQQHVPPVGPTKRPPTQTPIQPEEEEHHGGMPYSYNYDAGLSSKTETADDNGNVEGSYTYIDGAGVKRTVTYTVKGNEGFIAKGDINPDPGSDVGVPSVNPKPPPTKGGQPRPLPPTKGGHPSPPPTKGGHPSPPPTKGGHPRPPPTKGGHPATGWDKYPLGR